MAYLIAGFGVGILGGLFGVGGGEMVIPLLVYVFGFTQHKAQGTSLAMLLPPLGLLAAWRYYNAGHVEINAALLLALGFFVGAPLGTMGATALHPDLLRKVFGLQLLLISLHMIFREARGLEPCCNCGSRLPNDLQAKPVSPPARTVLPR